MHIYGGGRGERTHTHTRSETLKEELTSCKKDGPKILFGDATKGSILCQCSRYTPYRFSHHKRCRGRIIGTQGPSLVNHGGYFR